MKLQSPFEEMLALIGALQIPPGIGALVLFTDGGQTKAVWQGMSPPVAEVFLQIVTRLRDQLTETANAAAAAAGSTEQKN